MKAKLICSSLALLSFTAFAQTNIEKLDRNGCISEDMRKYCVAEKYLPKVCEDIYYEAKPECLYPKRPLLVEELEYRLNRLNENRAYITDVREMAKPQLMEANTKTQPWGGSFWPLIQGQIANNYQNKDYDFPLGQARKFLVWQRNYNLYQTKRIPEVHNKIMELSEKDLAELAPSEKYDLLLGDTSFDLTNRVWKFVKTWGEKKQWGFLSNIDLPAGYALPDASSLMTTWEGICHGWAVASGHTPRPEKTVWVTLPNGKRMPFYPDDLKALISLTWANSTIQDAVISEGLRCNQKSPEKDENGRFIDTKKDKDDLGFMPRCADVHPAVYHSAIINILGVEGRSFVVDKSSKASVANQPVSGYKYEFFNPKTGKNGDLKKSALSVDEYKDDPFKASRNASTRYIVGVDMTLRYVNWENPSGKDTNYPSDDKLSQIEFNYDLELDSNYNIVGGQWRVKKNGNARFLFNNNTHQPDFFWVVPRDYKHFFKPVEGLPTWNFSQSTLPPKEYLAAAQSIAHPFVYEESARFNNARKCEVYPIKKEIGSPVKVNCEFKYARPQPLLNVVNTLLEESRR